MVVERWFACGQKIYDLMSMRHEAVTERSSQVRRTSASAADADHLPICVWQMVLRRHGDWDSRRCQLQDMTGTKRADQDIHQAMGRPRSTSEAIVQKRMKMKRFLTANFVASFILRLTLAHFSSLPSRTQKLLICSCPNARQC